MKIRMFPCLILVAGLIGFVAGSVFSEDAPPSEEEMMKMLLELAKPGPSHELIDPMAGQFDVESKLWSKPGEPTLSKAKCSSRWILGGRYLLTDYEGDMAGMPFQGFGLLAYDNFKKEYQSVWVDSMSSGVGFSKGPASEDGKSFTTSMVWEGPMGDMPMRTEYTIVDKDTYKMVAYMSMGGGPEVKQMELTFKRKARAAAVTQPASPVCAPVRPVCRPNRGPGY